MQTRTKGWLWLGGGALLVTVLAGLSILGTRSEGEDGHSSPVFIAAVWALFIIGAAASIRGALVLLRRARRRTAVRIGLATAAAIPLAIVLHAIVAALTGIEEPVFFAFAVWAGPVLLIAAIIRALRPAGRERTAPEPGREGARPFPGAHPPAPRP